MDQSLEVYFCDLCNTSVPERDLEIGAASRFKGKVVGSCCLRDLRGGARSEARGGGRGGLLGVTILLLVAVAGATVFLDWRLSNETEQLSGQFAPLEGASERHADRLVALEARLGSTVVRTDLDVLSGRLGSLETIMRERAKVVDGSFGSAQEQVRVAQRDLEELRRGQREQAGSLGTLERDVRSLAEDLAALKAMPRAEPARRPDFGEPSYQPQPPLPVAGGLSPALSHEVGRLKDSDAGIRFEAVDRLVESKDPAVRGFLIEMVKDADPFVRRLTVEGLQGFRHASTVEALIDALMDPEEIVRHAANASLQNLTGEKVDYDPDASREKRTQGQRLWREWWNKNKAAF